MNPNESPFAAAMTARIEGEAGRYFPDLAGDRARVRLRRAAERELSSVYRFDLVDGDRSRSVIVKRCGVRVDPGRSADPEGPPPVDRPRLGVWTRPELLWQFERATLSAIKERFDRLDDPRFGSVRLLDVLPDERAIVMEYLGHPTLRTMLLRKGWLRRSSPTGRLVTALRNAGGWLRAYQGIPPLEHTRPRFTGRADFIESIGGFARYLRGAGVGGRFVRTVASKAEAAARSALPEALPTGLGHGDYAPRNVLVGPDDRVYVIDTVGKWQWPVYQDVAYFLTALKTVGPQVCSGGLFLGDAAMAACEREFLGGYFAQEPPPIATIRLFEIQCLLARWSSAAHRHERAGGARKVARRVELGVRSRYYRRCLERAVADLREPEAGAGRHP